MKLSTDNREAMVRFELEKSDLNFCQAFLGIENDYWDLTANRLYYSLFHAISALLIHNQIPEKSHKGAIMMFNFHFVRNGIFTQEEGQLVSFLQSKREEGDYNCYMSVEKVDVEPYIPLCESLLAKIKDACSSDS